MLDKSKDKAGTKSVAQQPIFSYLQSNRTKYPTPMSSDQIGQLLNETAWACKDQGWGVLLKESGSNCKQPFTGTLIAKDILTNIQQQILVDVLIDAEGKGTPSWGTEKPLDKPYVAPVDPQNTGTMPLPPPVNTVEVPPYNESYAVQFGQGCNAVYKESGKPFDPGMISVHSQRAAWDYYSGTMTWEQSYTKHINEFRAEYGLSPV